MDIKSFNQQEHKHGYKSDSSHPRQSGTVNNLSSNVSDVENDSPLYSVTSAQASVVPEEEVLASKLALEIEQLEVWLENQQNAQQGSISVIPTIKSLIHTRKELLRNILAS